MTCRITVFDGTTTVVMDNTLGLNVQYTNIKGGGAIVRFLDGSATKQQRWYKEQLTITGRDRAPSELRDIDYSKVLTITVETNMGTDVYSCISLGVTELWGLTTGEANWTLVAEEA